MQQVSGNPFSYFTVVGIVIGGQTRDESYCSFCNQISSLNYAGRIWTDFGIRGVSYICESYMKTHSTWVIMLSNYITRPMDRVSGANVVCWVG